MLQPTALYAHVRRLANPWRRQSVFLHVNSPCWIVVNINGQYYRDVLLMEDLLPEIWEFSEFYIFQQDGAPAHRARETVALLTSVTPNYINPTLWRPNSPDLNPDDYKIWGCMQETVYKTRVRDVEDLCKRIMQVWNDLDQSGTILISGAWIAQATLRMRGS